MRSIVFILIFSLFASLPASSQSKLWREKKLELSGGAGPVLFFGDFGGTMAGKNSLGIRDNTFLQTGYSVNGGIRYGYKRLSMRMSLALGGVTTNDHSSAEATVYRSTTFFTEPALTLEYFILTSGDRNRYNPSRGRKSYHSRFALTDLYVYTGLGAIGYGVSANAALSPLVTRKDGFTAVLPAGAGITFYNFANYKLGIEAGGRYAFTDLLDGYQSIIPGTEDMYYYLNLNLTFRFKVKR